MNISRTCKDLHVNIKDYFVCMVKKRMLVLWPLCLVILKRTKAINTVNRMGGDRLSPHPSEGVRAVLSGALCSW